MSDDDGYLRHKIKGRSIRGRGEEKGWVIFFLRFFFLGGEIWVRREWISINGWNICKKRIWVLILLEMSWCFLFSVVQHFFLMKRKPNGGRKQKGVRERERENFSGGAVLRRKDTKQRQREWVREKKGVKMGKKNGWVGTMLLWIFTRFFLDQGNRHVSVAISVAFNSLLFILTRFSFQ